MTTDIDTTTGELTHEECELFRELADRCRDEDPKLAKVLEVAAQSMDSAEAESREVTKS